ncbi:unnamed protein product [Mortierella alpina]
MMKIFNSQFPPKGQCLRRSMASSVSLGVSVKRSESSMPSSSAMVLVFPDDGLNFLGCLINHLFPHSSIQHTTTQGSLVIAIRLYLSNRCILFILDVLQYPPISCLDGVSPRRPRFR